MLSWPPKYATKQQQQRLLLQLDITGYFKGESLLAINSGTHITKNQQQKSKKITQKTYIIELWKLAHKELITHFKNESVNFLID